MATTFITMTGLELIKSKQQNWAKRPGFELVGGTIPDRGEKNYLYDLTDNLFEPLSDENLIYYDSGDGNETRDSKTRLAKMKALHSSSALVVNMFQYWQGKENTPLLYACGLSSKKSSEPSCVIENISSDTPKVLPITGRTFEPKIKFEEQFEISDDKSRFPHSPNIDVVIETGLSDIAIESKFTEPYNGRKYEGLKQKYVEDVSFWNELPNLYELAKEISPDNNRFQYLDAAQLIKHILGLKKRCEKQNLHLKRKIICGFRLLYLWYDVIGEDGVKHRKEIEQFAEIAQKDNINFSHTTYQEAITKLSKEYYVGNEKYCNYLTNRYL